MSSDKIEKMGVITSSEFDRLMLCLKLVEAEREPFAKNIQSRGWAGQKDVAWIESWARKTPPGQDASPLQVQAWLRLVGEKELNSALDISQEETGEKNT